MVIKFIFLKKWLCSWRKPKVKAFYWPELLLPYMWRIKVKVTTILKTGRKSWCFCCKAQWAEKIHCSILILTKYFFKIYTMCCSMNDLNFVKRQVHLKSKGKRCTFANYVNPLPLSRYFFHQIFILRRICYAYYCMRLIVLKIKWNQNIKNKFILVVSHTLSRVI